MKNYNPFKELAVRAGDQKRSVNWYQTQIQNLRGMSTNVNSMLRGGSGFGKDLRAQIVPGGLYLFQYDAKHQDTLPFWDKLPLVFPFRKVQGGFYGLNLHYLPYGLRFKLMGALMEVTHNNPDPKMRAQLSWSILNASSKFVGVQACVKHYLNDHVQSRFLNIPQEQWLSASMLPIEQFTGANKQTVWNHSRKLI